jgi:4-amino-4-deoxy-L-arabinose transferase-like glycosyltransferase
MAYNNDNPPGVWQPDHSLLLGQTACLCLGLGLIVWGLAPAVFERIITGHTPPLELLAMNGFVLALGVAYVAMQAFIRRRRRWAAWLAFALSVVLAGCGVAVVLATGMRVANTFLLVISALTAFATWLAIDAISWYGREERRERAAAAERLEREQQRRARGNQMFTHL